METITGDEHKRRREALGLSQAQYARRIGVHKRTVSRWEWGGSPIPSTAVAALLLVEGAPPPDELPRRRRQGAARTGEEG